MENHPENLVQIKPSTASSKPKLTLAEARERLSSATGKRYWRSLEELVDEPGFEELLENEFPAGAIEYQNSGVSRRNFLKLMGGSMALAGLTACTRQPDEPIVPYVRQPEDLIPGIPKFFATTMPFPTGAMPLVVRSNEFRPTKIEGNPQHPVSHGATDVFAQASLLDLYDPDRSQNSSYRGEPRNWSDFHAAVDQYKVKAAASGGAGLRFLTETVISPTLAWQIQTVLKKFPSAKWYQWDPVNRGPARAASQTLFGQYAEPLYKFDAANVVLSMDSEFLSGAQFPGFVRYSHDFVARRKLANDQPMNRLYVVESFHTTTGALADNRLPMRASDIPAFAAALLSMLGGGGSGSQGFTDEQQKFLQALAKDLKANAGASIVVPGEQQSAELHVLAAQINQALGNIGKTVVYTDPYELVPSDQDAGMRELIADMKAGKVDMLAIVEGNPVFNAPVDLDFEGSLDKVGASVHLSSYRNETTRAAQWHLHGTHYLETWSDARAYDGTCSLVQPLIAPLYGGHSAHELIALFSDTPEMTPYEAVTTYWRQNGKASGDFDANFRKWLHDGIIPNTTSATRTPSPRGGAPAIKPLDKNAIEVVFRPDPSIYDGRYANNAWLQECPKPVIRLEWDNAAMMSLNTAANHGFNQEDIIQITVDGRTLEAPVMVVYGMPDNSITLHLGYGREFAGRVGNGYGFNAYGIRGSKSPIVATAEKLDKTEDTYKLAIVQNFTLIDAKASDPNTQSRSVQGSEALRRDIIRVASLDEYKKDPHFAHGELYNEDPGYEQTLYPNYDYSRGYQWGMAVDMNSCVGCNACVIACQAENNSPVVGKEQVKIGRDMKWLRIDAYFTGDLHNPRAFFQPMFCQHCENAPCEPVCPVGATTHSPEGLNVMVYNRCVGTRYCLNNCPYKVRRFNFMLFADYETPSLKPMRNPDVTVRSRGVMEKCTYCVQRINAARIQAEVEEVQMQQSDPNAKRVIKDGEVLTACQQACPTEALVFGNVNDPNSKVTKIKTQPRNYGVLSDINTRPRTTYIANVVNPNMEIGDRTGAPGKSYINPAGAES
ncbi:MAG: TAT-variant-translocated molybdopterin oxidoreductase [Acidobacteria bacterium]|nr:TAT-variant-translocated molybdopterin oxidoreductase [Acidobacteriota bacterium]